MNVQMKVMLFLTYFFMPGCFAAIPLIIDPWLLVVLQQSL